MIILIFETFCTLRAIYTCLSLVHVHMHQIKLYPAANSVQETTKDEGEEGERAVATVTGNTTLDPLMRCQGVWMSTEPKHAS